jgi:glutamate-ammonia-ligase adenylyltransferase
LLNHTNKIASLTIDLPDPSGARLFFERFAAEHAREAERLLRNEGLLSDVLALAAWSPLLATTLAQHPDYVQWLSREREHTRVKTREELGESLARFTLTNSQLEPQVLLSRFRRRELLRIYLHDIRKVSTLVEVTEELSNLADAILDYALNLANQELENRFGAPSITDTKGRVTNAGFCIVALGKLGSAELNYASDIDLLFLYSEDGATSGKGTRGETSNREYFVKLAEAVARMVGHPSGEGAAYRVDLRLRPHGRDGALASSLEEAVRYYRQTAQTWEKQVLIRARAAAGSGELFARFYQRVQPSVFAKDETVTHALSSVRLAKHKIDRHHARDTRGFNVKLGRGGIREIEFIAQALQLAFGGNDEWLRASHTLISLGRLADRHLITERERVQLSDAYDFLRTLEHRLQMEHGLQTHTAPDEPERRLLFARRMNLSSQEFDALLRSHTDNVRAAYERVFGEPLNDAEPAESFDDASIPAHVNVESSLREPVDAEAVAAVAAATIFAPRIKTSEERLSIDTIAEQLRASAARSLNPGRASKLISRIASSLDKSNVKMTLSEPHIESLVRLCGTSEFFGEMIASQPSLLAVLARMRSGDPDYDESLRAAVESADSFRTGLGALRREWSACFVRIGMLDAANAITMRESNRRQTSLASASVDAAFTIVSREMERRYGEFQSEPQLAVLGLGRLGGGGMDYGSDLDVVLIYEDEAPSPVSSLNHAEFYSRWAELLVAALSSLTREGHLYRVDLRLRPDGRNGPTCSGATSFLNYLSERAEPWEWLAYVKLRAVAGNLSLGRRVEDLARTTIHDAARRMDDSELRGETRRVRDRLERERARRRGRAGLDIKYDRGGMLDVYFATRYLQLRDDVRDDEEDRSTVHTLYRLHDGGSLNNEDWLAMFDGYSLLRGLDHYLRLIVGRSTHVHSADHPAVNDIARILSYPTAAALTDDIRNHLENIRAAYGRVLQD